LFLFFKATLDDFEKQEQEQRVRQTPEKPLYSSFNTPQRNPTNDSFRNSESKRNDVQMNKNVVNNNNEKTKSINNTNTNDNVPNNSTTSNPPIAKSIVSNSNKNIQNSQGKPSTFSKVSTNLKEEEEEEEKPIDEDSSRLAEELKRVMDGIMKGESDQNIEELMKDFKNFKPSENYEEEMKKLMDNMSKDPQSEKMFGNLVEQLLSKDLMYEPLKVMHTKFPSYLSQNKNKLPTNEFQRYETQFKFITEILNEFDSNSQDTAKIANLIQQLQETGQPPREIVVEVAGPDVQLDADGLPKLGENCSIV